MNQTDNMKNVSKSKENNLQADVVIVGTGVGGCFSALNLSEDLSIIMITKSDLESSDSFLAQGGICVLHDDDDYDSYFEDTMRAGHYENRKESVDIMIRADQTIFASGGIGGRYKHSTNFPHLTGDAIDIAKKHGIRLEHLDYVQVHPTTLYSKKPGRRFLISESVRGEGALLYDKNGNRFIDELLPRDVVTKAIQEQMKKDGTDHVWLSLEKIPKEIILSHFPNIYLHCLEEGYDATKEWIPVVPAQHYFMGGIWVDSDSHTSMPNLYAVGETSCNGVHGKNRLASNSLLESLVFAKRAAREIMSEKQMNKVTA